MCALCNSFDVRPDKATWYRVTAKVPLVAVTGHFNARGFVAQVAYRVRHIEFPIAFCAQLFPVDGAGRLYAYYKQVAIVAKLGLAEQPHLNVSTIALADGVGENMIAEDVTFEEVALSVSQLRDDSMESLDGGGGDKESRAFQVCFDRSRYLRNDRLALVLGRLCAVLESGTRDGPRAEQDSARVFAAAIQRSCARAFELVTFEEKTAAAAMNAGYAESSLFA